MTQVPMDDGLEMPDVGAWAKRKYHFLSRYLTLFSTGMKNKWRERHFIDLFAGAGLARLRNKDEVVLTSSLIAADMKDPFTFIHSCDANASNCSALTARLQKIRAATTFRVIQGDANDRIDEILKPVPTRGALCVTLADPFGLHLNFATVEKIGKLNSDLIILLADNMDAVRNWSAYYAANPSSNLDRFMGEPGWRDHFAKSPSDKLAQSFRTRYQERLKSVGYSHFDSCQVQNDDGRDIYSLLYASRSPVGLSFWQKAQSVDEHGQRGLFGE